MLDRYRSCFCSITLIKKKSKTESKQHPMAPNSLINIQQVISLHIYNQQLRFDLFIMRNVIKE